MPDETTNQTAVDQTNASTVTTDAPGAPPVPVWNGTAWVLPDVAPADPVVTTSPVVTGSTDDPLLKTIGDTAAAIGTVKGEIGTVESEQTNLGKAVAAANALETAPGIVEGLFADLVELEQGLAAAGSGIVSVIKRAAAAFHGIHL